MLRTGVLLLVGLVVPELLHAQISPGALSAAHADLEGVDNCTRCHALGRGIDNTGCLSCHEDIAVRVRRREGLHGTYADRQCFECHKEHHGREFTLVRFDTSRFDHQRTGFDLKGKHRALMCSRCHTSSLVKDQAIRGNTKRMRSGTYLGLGEDCADCHQDVHRGQFRRACTECHSPAGWSPAAGFDHSRTAFPLVGRHLRVACSECHKPTGPARTMQFAGMSFGSCASCHHDPHRGRFAQSCESCHTAFGWASGAASRFDHATTRFPLKGKHAAVACATCHDGSPASGRRSFHPANFQRCSDCHQNVHTLGHRKSSNAPCEQCHVETGWKEGPAQRFNHAQTGFPLRGRHSDLSCNECHGPGGPKTVPGKSLRREGTLACADCHADVHRGQITMAAKTGNCEQCHSEEGFRPSTYSLAEHARSRFPLTGAHRAVPCDGCHKEILAGGTKVRQFRWEQSLDCARCHQDVHRGIFSASTDQECAACHTTVAWSVVQYAHDRTRFPLTGKHAGLKCWKCHGARVKHTQVASWKFRDTPTQCVACHGEGLRQR